MKNEQKNGTSVVAPLSGISDDRPDWLKKGSAGSEDVGVKDMILPRVDLLQALSPQIKKTDPSYIPGAEQGVLYNTVTGELYGPSVNFVPVMFRKEFILWKKRAAGGGFFGAFPTEAEANAAHCAVADPSVHEVVECHQHFIILLTDTGYRQAVFSMTKSKLKASRTLNTMVQMAEVDRFARAYRASAIEAKSDKGEFWNIRILPIGYVSQELYEKGKELYGLIKAGLADVDREAPVEGEASHESAEL